MFSDCLWEYEKTRATGEWIVSSEGEAHVFFVEGQVAWGTSTLSKRAFSGYLIRHGYASAEQVREALVEGRRTARPFGQLLKARGLCSEVMLREAAHFQLCAALRDAETILAEGGRQVFLDRADHPWNPSDCFTLSAFLIAPRQHRELIEVFAAEAATCHNLEQAALIHVASAEVLASRGGDFRHLAADSAELMRALRLLARGNVAATALITTSPQGLRLFRFVGEATFLVASASPEATTLGMAHLELQALAEALTRSLSAPSPQARSPAV
jgi:hypothetical protein